jgi:hypothetical protein
MGKFLHLLYLAPIAIFPLSSVFGEEVDFARDIRPILSDKCFFCHGPDEEHRKAKLRLDLKSDAFADKDGVTAFVAGSIEKSESWHRIISDDPDEVMPPPKVKKPLSEKEIELIRKWIEGGAEWTEHWSFTAPAKPEPPSVKPEWEKEIQNPIDRFILSELTGENVAPSPEADRRTLLRRITFDLTGLPPTSEERKAFLEDKSENAYETVVDRLLASPHFGERMALMWLDAARYGDTSVMHADGPRDMWPWRDWVVNAYNKNQPYDQFSIEQIAGDLLPEPTNAQLIASGFNRNHPSSDEGGAIPEELRVSYVADRVKTTSNVWLGLSMECVQCHDHKYDPISQKEYYQFYAYFNNTTDPGMQTRKGNQAPFVEVVTEVEEDKLTEVEKKITDASAKSAQAKSEALKPGVAKGDKEPGADLANHFKDLLHFFPLDDAVGNALLEPVRGKDAVGENTLIPATEAKHGRGIKLEGQVFDAEGITEFDNKSKFTLAAWIKIKDQNAGGAVFSKMDVSKSHRGYDFWMQGGAPGIHIINSWPGNAVKVVAEKKLEPGKWHHVAITYNGAGTKDSIRIYIDGTLTGHNAESGDRKLTGTIKNGVPFRIGGRTPGANFPGEVDDIHIYNRELKAEEIAWAQKDLVAEANSTLAAKRHATQKSIAENTLLNQSAAYLTARSIALQHEAEKREILTGKTTSMVMEDNPPEKMRMTYILDRGQYDSPRKEEAIPVGTPAILPPQPEDAPKNRLGLAQWLFSEEHPLTSRVAVNQLWQLFFGHGIVRTPADFGAQGEFPTHPELLDWLAVDFRESGWDTKRMIRQIVLSRTYRQSSNLGPEDLEHDPENRFFARASRPRLPAEMIRDNALALSGLLVKTPGGPGVKPYQPPGLWAEVSLGGNPKFVQDKGDKLFRRTLYTYWKRSSPPPAMVIFDAPNRETCVIQRPITNTPLQALAAMNDIQMIEASRHLAERVLKEGGENEEAKASWAFELATARKPESGELVELLDVYEAGLKKFGTDQEKATTLLSAGDSGRDASLPADQHAAWTVVASLLLNLDEVMTRN